jgi:hypothetical protein
MMTWIAGLMVAMILEHSGPDPSHVDPETERLSSEDESDTEATPDAPLLSRPSLPTPPIVAACEHLIDAESRRVGLPSRTLSLDETFRIASLGAEIAIDGDWAALEAIGIHADDTLDLPATPASLPVVIAQVLGRLGEAWDRPRLEATRDGLIVTSDQGAERLKGTILHPVGDLLHDDPLPTAIPRDDPPANVAAMAGLLQSMIEPEAWVEQGGRLAAVMPWQDGLLVTAPPSIQIEVRRLLDQLRATRPTEIEAAIEIVALDAEAARRLESSRGAGSLAAVRAVAAAAEGDPLLLLDVVSSVTGEESRATCSTPTLDAAVTIQPVWDPERRALRCRMRVRLDGARCGGLRQFDVDQEIAMPVGGLVIPLPRIDDQPPLVLLAGVRSR